MHASVYYRSTLDVPDIIATLSHYLSWNIINRLAFIVDIMAIKRGIHVSNRISSYIIADNIQYFNYNISNEYLSYPMTIKTKRVQYVSIHDIIDITFYRDNSKIILEIRKNWIHIRIYCYNYSLHILLFKDNKYHISLYGSNDWIHNLSGKYNSEFIKSRIKI